MMAERHESDHTCDALAGRECDWSTLTQLARRVIHTAHVAVMAHAAHERRTRIEDTGKDA